MAWVASLEADRHPSDPDDDHNGLGLCDKTCHLQRIKNIFSFENVYFSRIFWKQIFKAKKKLFSSILQNFEKNIFEDLEYLG